jgi:hypothetical protein
VVCTSFLNVIDDPRMPLLECTFAVCVIISEFFSLMPELSLLRDKPLHLIKTAIMYDIKATPSDIVN